MPKEKGVDIGFGLFVAGLAFIAGAGLISEGNELGALIFFLGISLAGYSLRS